MPPKIVEYAVNSPFGCRVGCGFASLGIITTCNARYGSFMEVIYPGHGNMPIVVQSFARLGSPGQRADSGVNAIVNVREQVVPALDAAEPALVDVIALDRLIEMIEIIHVNACAFLGVFDHRAGLEDEGPVARLGQEQLAGSLVESTTAQRRRIGIGAGHFHHAIAAFMEMAINPIVGTLQPHLAVALIAPA